MKEAEWSGRGSADNATTFASTPTPGQHRRAVLTRCSASFSVALTKLLKLYEAADNRSFVKGTLQVDATPEKFKTTTTAWYLISGAGYEKIAATAIPFSAAHVITGSKFGIILIQADSSGNVSTKVPAATPTTAMAYASANAALSAKPAPDTDRAELGWIIIEAKVIGWTAITDDLVAASDVTSITITDAVEGTLRAEDYVVNALPEGSRTAPLRALAKNTTFVAVLAATGTGTQIGKVNIEGYHVGAN